MKDEFVSSVGIWGQRHYDYLKRNKPTVINVMRMKGSLQQYLVDLNRDAQEMFELLMRQYILRRALGYEPKPVPTSAFFHFYDKLTEILNLPLSTETEKAALKLFDEISAEYMDMKKQSKNEIREEVKNWQPQDSGP